MPEPHRRHLSAEILGEGGKRDAGKQLVPIPMLGAGKLAHDVGIERSVFGRGEASVAFGCSYCCNPCPSAGPG
jgi:hypothetical protein